MPSPDNDPSVWNEPHLRGGALQPDPGDEQAAWRLAAEKRRENDSDRVEHSVWDEPSLSQELATGAVRDDLNYAQWIERGIAATSRGKSWLVTLVISLAAGPWAVIGALWSGHQGFAGALAAIFVAPLTEETMKAALAMMVVEKRPYLFRSPAQIVLCGIMSGLAFATIENLLYLHVYIQNPSPLLQWWRWTICTGLHVSCATIASLGLVRLWRQAIIGKQRPELSLASPFLIAAMVAHGAYNAMALVLEQILPF